MNRSSTGENTWSLALLDRHNILTSEPEMHKLLTWVYGPCLTCAKVCKVQFNPPYSDYVASRVYAMKRHSLLSKYRHIHREFMIYRFLADTVLFLIIIVHFYGYTRYIL